MYSGRIKKFLEEIIEMQPRNLKRLKIGDLNAQSRDCVRMAFTNSVMKKASEN